MNETITLPERIEKAAAAPPHTLRFSTITFHVDMSKATAPIIPVGIMAEILLPRLYGLGMVARIELSTDELARVSELPKPLVTRPFDYLALQFKEAWIKAAPGGGALDYVSGKYEYSAFHFGVPQPLDVPLQFFSDVSQSNAATLKAVVRDRLGTILDDQMFKLVQGTSQATNQQEEILQLKAA
jgi:hypothetical protein